MFMNNMNMFMKKDSHVNILLFAKQTGMILMALGEMGNFGAYFFAPASLVAPLGTVTVVSNALIAPLCLGEAFRRRDGKRLDFALSLA